jgi:hypothetical protein
VFNEERMKKDIRAIAQTFAPRSTLQRSFYHYFMKTWVNGANPAWSTRKWSHAVRARFVMATA